MQDRDNQRGVAPQRASLQDHRDLAPDDAKMVNSSSLEKSLTVTGSSALSPALCRAARGALEWTQEELAEQSTVSRSTIRDYEGSKHPIHRATAAQIGSAFEKEGLVLMQLPGVGFGIWKFEFDSPGSEAELLKALF